MSKLVVEDGKVGAGLKFFRVARVTGYLTGDANLRFNDAKKAELKNRVKHGLSNLCKKEEILVK